MAVAETLIDVFVKLPARERGGACASNRLTFQTSWAFCLLLELHKSKADYLIILDYHDDIVVFDSFSSPSSMDFYQVKTRKGKSPWKLNDLLKIAKNSTHSIWGKMYAHRIAFGEKASSINLISNNVFNVQRRTDQKPEEVEEFTLAEICMEGLRKVSSSLQKEHGLPYSPLLDIHTALRKDNLAVDDHHTHAKGRFLDFLEDNSIPTNEVSAAFRSLLQELQKRSNCESSFSTSDELKTKKGFSSTEFSELLGQMKKAAATDQWDVISHQLTTDGLDIISLKSWERAWSLYQIERLDYSNEILQRMTQKVSEVVRQCLAEKILLRPLTGFIQEARKRSIIRLQEAKLPLENEKICAIIITALDEIQQSPSIGAQP